MTAFGLRSYTGHGDFLPTVLHVVPDAGNFSGNFCPENGATLFSSSLTPFALPFDTLSIHTNFFYSSFSPSFPPFPSYQWEPSWCRCVLNPARIC